MKPYKTPVIISIIRKRFAGRKCLSVDPTLRMPESAKYRQKYRQYDCYELQICNVWGFAIRIL